MKISKGHLLLYALILMIFGNIALYYSKNQSKIPKPILGMDYKAQEKLYLIFIIIGAVMLLSISLINIKSKNQN